MSGNEHQPKLIYSFLAADEESRLLDLIDYLEEKIPASYRAELLTFLLPRALPDETSSAACVVEYPPDATGAAPDESSPAAPAPAAMSLGAYRTLLARRGDTLLKALATMQFAEAQLEVRWLTPAEIVRIMGDFDEAHTIYRSNVSNVLRKEESLVARRPRGRGYEYGLTRKGRARVVRELSLIRIDR